MTSKKGPEKGVSADTAAIIHNLLGEVLEGSLRQQLLTGEFSPAMVGKCIDWLKANSITVDSSADKHLQALSSAFKNADFNFLSEPGGREI